MKILATLCSTFLPAQLWANPGPPGHVHPGDPGGDHMLALIFFVPALLIYAVFCLKGLGHYKDDE